MFRYFFGDLGSLGFELFLWGLGSSGLQVTEVLLFLWDLDLGSLGFELFLWGSVLGPLRFRVVGVGALLLGLGVVGICLLSLGFGHLGGGLWVWDSLGLAIVGV